LVEDLQTPNIIFSGIGKYVYDAACLESAQEGKLFSEEAPRADILKANGIEHPGLGLIDARRRISLHRLGRDALYDDCPQLVQVNERREFPAVSKGAACRPDRVLETHTGDFGFDLRDELGHHDFQPSTLDSSTRQALAPRSQTTLSDQNTGPSVQTL